MLNDEKDQYCYMVFDFVQYELAKMIAFLHARRRALSIKEIKNLSSQFCQGQAARLAGYEGIICNRTWV